ncbi:MAG: hypothetical protein ACP5NX_01925 [Candidatus Bilamarchaeaceae archaeon]
MNELVISPLLGIIVVWAGFRKQGICAGAVSGTIVSVFLTGTAAPNGLGSSGLTSTLWKIRSSLLLIYFRNWLSSWFAKRSSAPLTRLSAAWSACTSGFCTCLK